MKCFSNSGDSAYNLSPWLMKVIPNNLNMRNEERQFNRNVRSVRGIVERVIGVLKMRFRCILGERQLRYNETKVGKIVYACATLHNFLIFNSFDIMHGVNVHQLNVEIDRQEIPNANYVINIVNDQRVATNRRNELIQYFNNPMNVNAH